MIDSESYGVKRGQPKMSRIRDGSELNHIEKRSIKVLNRSSVLFSAPLQVKSVNSPKLSCKGGQSMQSDQAISVGSVRHRSKLDQTMKTYYKSEQPHTSHCLNIFYMPLYLIHAKKRLSCYKSANKSVHKLLTSCIRTACS